MHLRFCVLFCFANTCMPTQKCGAFLNALILKCILTKPFSPKGTCKCKFQFAFLGVLNFRFLYEQKFAEYICRWRQGSEYASTDFSASCFLYLLNWVNSTSAPPGSVMKSYSLTFV